MVVHKGRQQPLEGTNVQLLAAFGLKIEQLAISRPDLQTASIAAIPSPSTVCTGIPTGLHSFSCPYGNSKISMVGIVHCVCVGSLYITHRMTLDYLPLYNIRRSTGHGICLRDISSLCRLGSRSVNKMPTLIICSFDVLAS